MSQPTPGSDAAVALGCTCPVLDNGRGRGAYGQAGCFWVDQWCPVHGRKEPATAVRALDAAEGT